MQMQFDDRVRKDIRAALIYPTFLIIMGIVAVLFIFIFVVPRFAAMMKDRIVSLPAFSRSIFMSGLFIRDNLLPLTGLAIMAAVGIHLLLRRPAVRFWLHEVGARLPVIGQALVEAEAGRWTATLATLLRNRVPLVHSLALARETLRLESLKARLSQVERAVRGGSALAGALEDYRIFDESLVNLVRVGERSGRLPEMLKSGADLAAEKGRDRIKRFIALLEPASILFIGAIIGVIVISMFTAIASINSVPL
jgi:general secretion pathway protein F